MISSCHLCVAEDQMHVLVSSAKVLSPELNELVSIVPKLSQNAFVARDKHVYLEMSSGDYELVASEEHVRLQWGNRI